MLWVGIWVDARLSLPFLNSILDREGGGGGITDKQARQPECSSEFSTTTTLDIVGLIHMRFARAGIVVASQWQGYISQQLDNLNLRSIVVYIVYRAHV